MGRDTGMSMPIGIYVLPRGYYVLPRGEGLFGCRHWSPIGWYWTCYFW
jgi:hypothetical protein